MRFKEKAKKFAKYNASDATAISIESIPFFAAFEVGVSGMSDEVSLRTRLSATVLAYCGLGWAYGKGRDTWRKAFSVTDDSSEALQAVHDAGYTVVFNMVVSPPMYYLLGGERDLEKIAIGTGCAMGFGAINGIPMGWFTGIFRDLTGLEKCERKTYPDFIKRQSQRTKRTIATGLAVASIASMAAIYSYLPNQKLFFNDDVAIEVSEDSLEEIVEL